MMNAKQYLEQLEVLDSRIQVNRELLQEKRLNAKGGGAIRYDKDPVQVSLVDSKVERQVVDIVSLEQTIEQEIKDYENAKQKVIEQIKGLDDAEYILILFKVYVQYKGVSEAADEMGRHYNTIKKKHKQALNEFEQKYKPLKRLP